MKKTLFTPLLVVVFIISPFSKSVAQSIITTVVGCGIGNDSLALVAELAEPVNVVKDKSGNLFITDNANGLIRKINSSGIMSTYAGTGKNGHTGDGGPATAADLGGLIGMTIDKTGNIYIAENYFHCIRKIDTAGIISTIAGLPGNAIYNGDNIQATSATLANPSGIAIDTQGNIFIADYAHGRIRKINSTGIITTVAGNGTFTAPLFGNPATASSMVPYKIAMDKNGNLFISNIDFSTNSNFIMKVDTAGILTRYAGTGVYGYAGNGGPATAAQYSTICGLATDTAGHLYIADTYYGSIRRIDKNSGIITGYAGTATSGFGGDGGWAISAKLNSPEGIYFDDSNNLYIADLANNRIRMMNSMGVINTVAGRNMLFGEGYDRHNTELSFPGRPAIDADGNLYIPDVYNNRVRKTDAISGAVTTIAGNGLGGYSLVYSGDGGPATLADIHYPASAAFDTSGNMYFTDRGNHSIRKVNKTGTITTVAGIGTSGYSGDNGPAVAAQLNYPDGIAIDVAGNIYVADESNNLIRKINSAGIISRVSGTGTSGYSGDGGPASAAILSYPVDLTNDAYGNLYICDAGNSRIRKIDTNGIISTIAGTGTAGFSGDGGPAYTATLNYPKCIRIDTGGNIFIADYNNNRIRMINPAGIISTVAGNGIYGFSGDGGPATSAKLSYPSGITFDKSGDMYISDAGNHRIRKVHNPGVSVPAVNSISGNMTAFPNPTKDRIVIETTIADPDFELTMYDATGRMVYNAPKAHNHHTIDMQNLSAGVYQLSLINKSGQIKTIKVVKE